MSSCRCFRLSEIELFEVDLLCRQTQRLELFGIGVQHADRAAHVNIPIAEIFPSVFDNFIHRQRAALDAEAHKGPKARIALGSRLDLVQKQGFLAGADGVVKIDLALELAISPRMCIRPSFA